LNATGQHHVVIVGGGFGGLYAAQRLGRAGARVTLIDRRNFHLFQPLLYQVATGGLSPANIAAPLRSVLRKQQNTEVMMADVVDVDVNTRRLMFREAHLAPLDYDTLIVATGSQFNYFGHDAWQAAAPGLKSIEDATEIRRRVFNAFEEAELEKNPERQKFLLTFVVVGGGPTGVELSGAVAEVAHYTLHHDFRTINPHDAKVLLFEAGPAILTMFPETLQSKAEQALAKLGVEVRKNVRVTDIHSGGVTIQEGDQQHSIPAATVLWTAGVKASSFGERLATSAGQTVDRAGKVTVEADCSLPNHPEILVIGDLASFNHTPDGKPLPALAPVAMQQGRYVADLVARRLENEPAPPPFHYHDKGTLATIGRSQAVAHIGRLQLSGFFAWITWLFVHLMYLVQFHNRVLVFLQWSYNYFSRGRSARLITGEAECPRKSDGAAVE
jgi:NADH dehydrogenase